MMDLGMPDSPESLGHITRSLETFRNTRAGFMTSMGMFFELHTISFLI